MVLTQQQKKLFMSVRTMKITMNNSEVMKSKRLKKWKSVKISQAHEWVNENFISFRSANTTQQNINTEKCT